jgi:hypothetical protein
MARRRQSNSVTICFVNGPPNRNAATAAFCEMEQGFDVLRL